MHWFFDCASSWCKSLDVWNIYLCQNYVPKGVIPNKKLGSVEVMPKIITAGVPQFWESQDIISITYHSVHDRAWVRKRVMVCLIFVEIWHRHAANSIIHQHIQTWALWNRLHYFFLCMSCMCSWRLCLLGRMAGKAIDCHFMESGKSMLGLDVDGLAAVGQIAVDAGR